MTFKIEAGLRALEAPVSHAGQHVVGASADIIEQLGEANAEEIVVDVRPVECRPPRIICSTVLRFDGGV